MILVDININLYKFIIEDFLIELVSSHLYLMIITIFENNFCIIKKYSIREIYVCSIRSDSCTINA